MVAYANTSLIFYNMDGHTTEETGEVDERTQLALSRDPAVAKNGMHAYEAPPSSDEVNVWLT